MVRGSRVVDYTDEQGLRFYTELPNGVDDPSRGHIIGPPFIDAEKVKFDRDEFLTRLHNELFALGVITLKDAERDHSRIALAIRAASADILSVQDVLEAFREG